MHLPTGGYFLGTVMIGADEEEKYSDEEATQRMNNALRRALNTPPKPTRNW